jgi:protein-S-isoprenylcysteine O-methyltransferase Ste14
METERRDIHHFLFTYRSYIPIPFFVLMVVFAEPTLTSLLAGGGIGLIGEALRFWGVSIAGSETRTTGTVGGTYLITNGPFAHVRNPLYLGNILLYTSLAVMSMALFPWLVLVTVAWFTLQYHLIVTREEEYLRRTFGKQFEHYAQHVPRFLPRVIPYRSPSPAPKSVNFREGLASERRTLQAIAVMTLVMVFIYLGRGWGW